jgi:tetratricopeptide (TPR) repeat protein
LAALHTRASRFTEAAVCCRTLESVYHDAGFPDEATRYGDLAAKYEERSSAAPAEASATALTTPKFADVAASSGDVASETSIESAVAAHQEVAAMAPVIGHAPAEFEIQSAIEVNTAAEEPVASENEIDLSSEWEDSLAVEVDTDAAPEEAAPAEVAATESETDPEAVKEAVEEIRFYLSNGMQEEARATYTKLYRLRPEPALLSTLRHEIESAAVESKTPEPEAIEEILVADIPVVHAEETPAVPEPKPAILDALVSDLESSLGEGFLPETTVREATPQPEPEPPQAVEVASIPAQPQQHPSGKLDNFVSDLEASLGDSFLAEAPQIPATPDSKPDLVAATPEVPIPAAAPAAQAPAAMAAAATHSGSAQDAVSASPAVTYQPPVERRPTTEISGGNSAKFDLGPAVDLGDMFGELKHELEEDSSKSDEDPETHYNLGVAFREMGLLDEAIGELQKVCQAVDRGHSFPHIMQTYTWLSQCFLDKGIPEAAIRWYEKALKLPTIDAETRTALHYELATSYETAGDKTAALNHFMEVYGSNIDYRDVGERIKTLKS